MQYINKKGKSVKVERYVNPFFDLKEELKNDKDFILKLIPEVDANLLGLLSKKMRADKDVVIACVSKSGCDLFYASKELRADKEVVAAAMSDTVSALEYASEEFRSNKDIALKAVKERGYLVYYLSKELQTDKDVALTAIKQNWENMKYLPKQMQEDKDLLITAIKQNVNAEKYVPQELKEDDDIKLELKKYYDPEMYDFLVSTGRKHYEDEVQKFEDGEVKLANLDKKHFTFQNISTIIDASKDKILKQFEKYTKNMDLDEPISKELEESVKNKMQEIENIVVDKIKENIHDSNLELKK